MATASEKVGAAPLVGGGATSLHSHTHPDLATHDALGLATDSELAGHAGAADPHPGYLLESAHQEGRVTADRSTSTIALSNIADLSAFTLAANKKYRFRAVLFCTSNALTVGIHHGVNFTGTATYIRVGEIVNPVTAPTVAGSAVAFGVAAAVNTKIIATTAGPGTAPVVIVIEGLIEVGAAGGTFSFQHGSETATATTTLRGSYATVDEIA